MMASIMSWVLTQLPGMVIGLVFAWHIPIPPLFVTFWKWVWTSMTGAVAAAVVPAVAPPAPPAPPAA